MWHVAIYIRLSREDGNDESNSIINQRKIAAEYLQKSFQGDYVIAGEYIDDGLTGTDDSRADFQRMIYDIETGKVDCVIVKNLSRAFRNYADQGHYLEAYFPLHNVRLITISDTVPLDTYLHPEVVHNFEVPITGVMNDRYAYKTSVDVRATLRTKRSNGEFVGAFAPYGYQKNPGNKNQIIIDEQAAAVVRDIFAWFTRDGMSIHGIVQYLNERGEANPTEYKRQCGLAYYNPHAVNHDGLWNPKTVRYILRNRMYVGTMVQGQQRVVNYKVHARVSTPQDEWFVVPNTHAAIIPPEEFAKAQSLLARDTRTAPHCRQVHLFAGLIRCGDCKRAMTRKVSKGYAYFSCRTYKDQSKTRCSKHSIREDNLRQAVLLAIQRQIALFASPTDIINNIDKSPSAQCRYRRMELLLKQRSVELDRVIHAIDSLYGDWKNADISREEYLRLKTSLAERSEEIRRNIGHIAAEREAVGLRYDKPLRKALLQRGNIDSLDRSLLVELVNAVHVFEGGRIRIDFCFSDPIARALGDLTRASLGG